LGPEERLLEPTVSNPKGYWELEPIVSLNDQILSKLGGDWQEPPALPEGWENAPRFERSKERARILIERNFAGAQVWGWKDPRTCLTLPFWQRLLPPMQYVICFRNPMDVAKSLARRDGFSKEKSFYLWLNHMMPALRLTAGHRRMFVFYEEILVNWRQELRRLSEFIGKPERAERAEVQNEIRGFIDGKLRHHHTTISEAVVEGESEPETAMLDIARHIFMNHKQERFVRRNDLEQMLQAALDAVAPIIKENRRKAAQRWKQQLQSATEEIASLIPAQDKFILVGEAEWSNGEVDLRRHYIPFLERDGQYWGPPGDDATAINELERLRNAGSRFIVFRSPVFWWLGYYSGFHSYLRSHFRCILENDRLVAFDLRPEQLTAR
jgi:hypothetical protein